MTHPDQHRDINLEYVATQRRVSEWVQQTQHDAAFFHSSQPKSRKGSNTTRSGGKSSGRRSRSSRQSKARRSTIYEHRTTSTKLRSDLAPIPPVMAIVSSSVMIWALDLLPSILALCGFAFILNLAATSIDEKVRWLPMCMFRKW